MNTPPPTVEPNPKKKVRFWRRRTVWFAIAVLLIVFVSRGFYLADREESIMRQVAILKAEYQSVRDLREKTSELDVQTMILNQQVTGLKNALDRRQALNNLLSQVNICLGSQARLVHISHDSDEQQPGKILIKGESRRVADAALFGQCISEHFQQTEMKQLVKVGGLVRFDLELVDPAFDTASLFTSELDLQR